MKKLFIVILFVFGCLGISLVAYGLAGEGKDKLVSAAGDAVNVAVQSPSPTITNTATPNRLIETKQAAEAELAVLNIVILSDSATSTAQSGNDFATSEAKIRFDGATSTAQVYMTQTAPTVEAIAMIVQNNIKKENTNSEIEKWEKITLEIFWPLFWRIISFMFSIVALWKGVPRIIAWLKRISESEQESEPIAIETEPIGRLEIKKDNSLNIYNFPCSDERLYFMANEIVQNGRGISYEKWTPEKNGFSRDDWKAIIKVMIESGLAVYKNGKNEENGSRLITPGWEYFKRVNSSSPPPRSQI